MKTLLFTLGILSLSGAFAQTSTNCTLNGHKATIKLSEYPSPYGSFNLLYMFGGIPSAVFDGFAHKWNSSAGILIRNVDGTLLNGTIENCGIYKVSPPNNPTGKCHEGTWTQTVKGNNITLSGSKSYYSYEVKIKTYPDERIKEVKFTEYINSGFIGSRHLSGKNKVHCKF